MRRHPPARALGSVRALLFALLIVPPIACAPSGPPGDGDGDAALARTLGALVERHHELGRFSGAIAVNVDGRTILERGFGPADRDRAIANGPATRFPLASLTKQFTAAAILQLEADGRLRVEDPVSTHLPSYPRPQGDRITLHHLLTHTSGVPSLWRLGDGLEDVEATTAPIATSDLLALFQERELLFEPGERFRYSNSGYVLLAAVIEAVSGRTYADHLESALFRPLGMHDTGCGDGDDDAIAYRGHAPEIRPAAREHPSWSIGDGCARSTVRDLAIWDRALSDDTLLPRAQRDKLFAPHVELRSGARYGYGWFLSEEGGRPVAHHSGAGEGLVAEMHRFADGLSIMVLANYAPELGVNAAAAIVEQVAASYFAEPFEPPPTPIELPAGELGALAGRYAMETGGELVVTHGDGRLWVETDRDGWSIFDYGLLADPGQFERAAETARRALEAALEDDFSRLTLCEPLADELAPGELRAEWREMLDGHGTLREMTPARTTRYPGEDTLIAVTRLAFARRELFFAIDLTPRLEICGWYGMDPAEFEIRRRLGRSRRVPLVALARAELLADGFNDREPGVRLSFRRDDEGRLRLTVRGAVEHSGERVTASSG